MGYKAYKGKIRLTHEILLHKTYKASGLSSILEMQQRNSEATLDVPCCSRTHLPLETLAKLVNHDGKP